MLGGGTCVRDHYRQHVQLTCYHDTNHAQSREDNKPQQAIGARERRVVVVETYRGTSISMIPLCVCSLLPKQQNSPNSYHARCRQGIGRQIARIQSSQPSGFVLAVRWRAALGTSTEKLKLRQPLTCHRTSAQFTMSSILNNTDISAEASSEAPRPKVRSAEATVQPNS